MKNLKVTLAVVGLIGIGFVMGFYTHRYFSLQEIQKVAHMRSPEGFREAFYLRINASDLQREQIEPILKRYSRAMGKSHKDWRQSWHALIDSMHQEVIPLLDANQALELRKFNRRFSKDEDDKRGKRK